MNLKFKATKHRVLIISCMLLPSVAVLISFMCFEDALIALKVILYLQYMLYCYVQRIHLTITTFFNVTLNKICRLLGFHTCGWGQRKIVWTLSTLQAHLNINALVTSMLVDKYLTFLSFCIILVHGHQYITINILFYF